MSFRRLLLPDFSKLSRRSHDFPDVTHHGVAQSGWCGLVTGLPQGAKAGALPALFDVVGVASDDVLNIRVKPTPSSDIIGGLTYARKGVEVVRLDPTGRWGLVNSGERSGWVSMRFLAQQPGQDGFGVARPLYCAGTEPFWSVQIGPAQNLQFDLMGEPQRTLAQETHLSAAGRSDKYAAVWGSTDARIVGVMTRASCSDGMSDREFAIAVDFLLFGAVGSGIVGSGAVGSGAMVSGCCALSRN